MDNNTIGKLNGIVDDNSKCLVGIILKRMEVLEAEEKLSVEQIKSLYRSLTKELIYENGRYLKRLIKVELTKGSIVFKSQNSE